jgi:hypothetical protein
MSIRFALYLGQTFLASHSEIGTLEATYPEGTFFKVTLWENGLVEVQTHDGSFHLTPELMLSLIAEQASVPGSSDESAQG